MCTLSSFKSTMRQNMEHFILVHNYRCHSTSSKLSNLLCYIVNFHRPDEIKNIDAKNISATLSSEILNGIKSLPDISSQSDTTLKTLCRVTSGTSD